MTVHSPGPVVWTLNELILDHCWGFVTFGVRQNRSKTRIYGLLQIPNQLFFSALQMRFSARSCRKTQMTERFSALWFLRRSPRLRHFRRASCRDGISVHSRPWWWPCCWPRWWSCCVAMVVVVDGWGYNDVWGDVVLDADSMVELTL